MRKTLCTLISAVSLGLVSYSNNCPPYQHGKVAEAQQNSSSALVQPKDNIIKERSEAKSDNTKRTYRTYTKEELASIDQKIAEYKKTFESAGYRGEALEWINFALDNARAGKRLNIIESDIEMAKKERGYVDAIFNPEEIIREVYTNLIRIEGPKHARESLRLAKEEARSGELWRNVESDLMLAEGYAREADIVLDDKEKIEIKELYIIGIKENGPKKAAKYLKEAADLLEKYGSVSDIQFCLSRAREYAKEAGFKLIKDDK